MDIRDIKTSGDYKDIKPRDYNANQGDNVGVNKFFKEFNEYASEHNSLEIKNKYGIDKLMDMGLEYHYANSYNKRYYTEFKCIQIKYLAESIVNAGPVGSIDRYKILADLIYSEVYYGLVSDNKRSNKDFEVCSELIKVCYDSVVEEDLKMLLAKTQEALIYDYKNRRHARKKGIGDKTNWALRDFFFAVEKVYNKKKCEFSSYVKHMTWAAEDYKREKEKMEKYIKEHTKTKEEIEREVKEKRESEEYAKKFIEELRKEYPNMTV